MSALERTRSAVWPLVLALGVGLAVGFAGGYGVGTRTRSDTPSMSSTPDATDNTASTPPAAPRSTVGQTPAPSPRPQTTMPAPSGREFTESTVPVPPPAAAARAAAPAVVPPATADGRLLVRSTPAGARVFVDGKDHGVTPAAIRDLARGAHRVRVARDGYAAAEQRVVLTAARPSQSLTFAMTRRSTGASPAAAQSARPAAPADAGVPRYTGTLVVDSRPPGAKVYVDGRLVGTTPLSVPDVRAGEHAIRLEHDGYRRWSSSVRIVAAEQNRVTASLER